MDSLKILRKGQSVSQYNKTKSKRDQYSCQKKCFLWRVKKTLILLSHKFVWKPLKRVERCPFFEAFYSCGIITQYNGSPSFQPGLWYINLKMSLLNTKKDFSLCFHFLLVLFLFSLSFSFATSSNSFTPTEKRIQRRAEIQEIKVYNFLFFP